MTVRDVPFTGLCRSGDTRCFTLSGAAVQSHVVSIANTYSGVNGSQSFSYRMTGVNYNNPEKVPILEISFSL